jgi:hypothetical protein
MSKHRKKPVVIDAILFNGSEQSAHECLGFCAPHEAKIFEENGLRVVEIRTLEGYMEASQGDWIIRGVKGEVYPCKPDIFAATYEPA